MLASIAVLIPTGADTFAGEKDIVILGTATPGGGFPVYGDAFAETVNQTDSTLQVQPRNTKGSTENVPLLGLLKLLRNQGRTAQPDIYRGMALVFQGITYTTQKDVINLGPIHATTEQKKTIPLPPILGGIALVGGIVLLFAGRKK